MKKICGWLPNLAHWLQNARPHGPQNYPRRAWDGSGGRFPAGRSAQSHFPAGCNEWPYYRYPGGHWPYCHVNPTPLVHEIPSSRAVASTDAAGRAGPAIYRLLHVDCLCRAVYWQRYSVLVPKERGAQRPAGLAVLPAGRAQCEARRDRRLFRCRLVLPHAAVAHCARQLLRAGRVGPQPRGPGNWPEPQQPLQPGPKSGPAKLHRKVFARLRPGRGSPGVRAHHVLQRTQGAVGAAQPLSARTRCAERGRHPAQRLSAAPGPALPGAAHGGRLRRQLPALFAR